MHILLLIGSIPVKDITLVFSVFISMENSDAVLKLCTEYYKSSSDLAMSTLSSANNVVSMLTFLVIGMLPCLVALDF
jgi:hypothetical protein